MSNWRPILVWEVSTIAIPGQRLRERCESDFGDVQSAIRPIILVLPAEAAPEGDLRIVSNVLPRAVPKEADAEEKAEVARRDPDKSIRVVPLEYRVNLIPERIVQYECGKVNAARKLLGERRAILRIVFRAFHHAIFI